MSNEFKDDYYKKQEDKSIGILEKKAEAERQKAEERKLAENIKYFEDALKEREKRKNKRDLKNSSSKIKNKIYKGNLKKRIKALIATAIVIGGIAAGTYGIKKHHEYIYDYAATATRVEEMSDDELKDYIENILKEEVSKATGVDTEEINFSRYSSGTSFQTTKVTAGENEYKYVEDLRSPCTEGNLKSKRLRSVISMTRNANGDRKELIKALKKAQEFSDEKDLVVDGDKLKEVDSDKTHEDDGR